MKSNTLPTEYKPTYESAEIKRLKDRISGLSDEELLMMASGNRDDYTYEAVYYATEELIRRGIPTPSSVKVLPPSPISHQLQFDYRGVRGWLLFFCLSLTVFSPLGTIVLVSLQIPDIVIQASQFSGLPKVIFLIITFSLPSGFSLFGIYAGIALWRVRHNAVKIAKTYLFTFFICNIIYSLLLNDRHVGMFWLVSTIVYFALWYAYLIKSKRVNAIYVENTNIAEGQTKEISQLNFPDRKNSTDPEQHDDSERTVWPDRA